MTRQCVYIVDDEIQVLEVMQLQLEMMGCDVVTFSSPEPYFEQLGQLSPGVVISDQRMPYADELVVVHCLTEHPACFGLILVSGFPGTRIPIEAMRQSVVAVLDKRYNTETLQDSLDQVFAELEKALSKDEGLPGTLPDGELSLEKLLQREREVIDLV